MKTFLGIEFSVNLMKIQIKHKINDFLWKSVNGFNDLMIRIIKTNVLQNI